MGLRGGVSRFLRVKPDDSAQSRGEIGEFWLLGSKVWSRGFIPQKKGCFGPKKSRRGRKKGQSKGFKRAQNAKRGMVGKKRACAGWKGIYFWRISGDYAWRPGFSAHKNVVLGRNNRAIQTKGAGLSKSWFFGGGRYLRWIGPRRRGA